ncbi:unnamed protein product [Moneuplotes crassus]|uniref:Uncharacterized protein n=1 Tax=Euplotes crassus TaxID=5936 RepID=A0AAD1UJW0_EUPCR|nr:unnamed protein product [Moneuplotes crassus]
MGISSRVCREILISTLKINASRFKRVVAAFKHVHLIRFSLCKISIPKAFNLSQALRNTKINIFDCSYCGNSNYCGWKNNPQEFASLIKALVTSPDLKLSLQRIEAYHSCISMSKIRKILDANSFNNVDIIS